MSTGPSFDPAHPLLLDRPRLERLKNRMYSCIRQVTGRNALVGGEDADDVLSVAVIDLLSKPVVGINSWEGQGGDLIETPPDLVPTSTGTLTRKVRPED